MISTKLISHLSPIIYKSSSDLLQCSPSFVSSSHHVFRRFLRGSRYSKIIREAQQEQIDERDFNEAPDNHQQQQERRDNFVSKSERQYYENNNNGPARQDVQFDKKRDRQKDPDWRPSQKNQQERVFSKGPVGLTFNKKASVKKLLQDTSSYGGPDGKGKIVGDPFLSGPYVRGTNMKVVFDQGNDAREEGLRRKIDPANTSVIMFPGQGTQFVGMAGDPSSLPRYIQVLYEIASSILNYDLLDLCTNGPAEKLNQTVHCQPAILVSSLAALERLRDTNPESVESCVASAGFSVGEISALVFAGVFSFEDAVRIVKVRAEAMQIASEMVPSGMSTVFYGADSKLNYSMLVAKEWCRREYNIENPVCSVANYLFPHCKVVAGNIEALEFLEANYKDFNLRKVKRLPVSGAFHTELMRPAAEPMKEILKNIKINRPRMLVFSNATGYRYHSSDDIRRYLPRQIYQSVMWEQILQNLYQRPKESEYPSSYECGPGSSLTAVLKQVNAKAHKKCESIHSY